MSIIRLFTGLAAIGVLALAGPARADWLKAETPHFVVYGDIDEGTLRDYARRMERFDALLRIYLPPPRQISHPPLAIYLARGADDMQAVWPGIPSNVSGFYTAGQERIFTVSNTRQDRAERTLLHEYGHHYMLQNFAAAYPVWFVEGFAEYFATADVRPGSLKIGEHDPGRMNSLTQGANALLPMETMLGSSIARLSPSQRPTFYAQAWAITHYFMSTDERKAKLGAYLAAIAAGGDPISALEPTVGRTPSQLQDDVRIYLLRINTFSPQVELPHPQIAISRMPPSARDLAWLDLRLARFVPETLRAANLEEARLAARKYPTDAWAARVLAQAHLDMQQNAEAVAVLNANLQTQPDDPLVLRMKAVALMDQADALDEGQIQVKFDLYDEARGALTQAYERDPNDYRVYTALARNRAIEEAFPDDNDVNVLIRASQLAPQVQGIRVQTARALISHELYREAVQLLEPVANNPHGGDSLAEVRTLLAEAKQKACLTTAADVPLPDAEAGDVEAGDTGTDAPATPAA